MAAYLSMAKETPYGPSQKPWRETVSKMAISPDGKLLVSPPSQDPHSLASYPQVPGMTSQWYQVPSTGLSEEERSRAYQETWSYLYRVGENYLGYQNNTDCQYCEPAMPYLSRKCNVNVNNCGDPFFHGSLNQNTKVMERNMLDYYASLWHAKWPHDAADPDTYWGYILTMGSTEGSLQSLWNARDYFCGQLTQGDVLRAGGMANSMLKPVCPPGNPNAFSPVAFFAENAHFSFKKCLQMLQIPSFAEVGNDKYPDSNPLSPGTGTPWPDGIPTNASGNQLVLGTIDVKVLTAFVDFFSGKGHPVIILLTYGTTFEGACDDVKGAGEAIIPVLKKNDMYSYEIQCQSGDSSIFLRRQGFWFHIDGALSATYMPFVEMAHKQGLTGEVPGPIFDFRLDFISSIITSTYKWVPCQWPSGIFMTKTGLMPMRNVMHTYIGLPDTTVSGSRNGLSAMILWSYCSSASYDKQVEAILHCLQLAQYTEKKLQKLEEELKMNLYVSRAQTSLAVLFKKPSEKIVRKFTLCCNNLWINGEYRHYCHVYAMPSVTKEKIDRLIADLQEPNAFEY